MIGHVDLRARYMGLDLAHPIVASAGPLSKDLDGVRRLEDGGAAAIVLFSLFEEGAAPWGRRDRREFQPVEELTG